MLEPTSFAYKVSMSSFIRFICNIHNSMKRKEVYFNVDIVAHLYFEISELFLFIDKIQGT